MALIQCPECGQEVSDKAKVCIKCGYPLEDLKPKQHYLFFKASPIPGMMKVNVKVINYSTEQEITTLRMGETDKIPFNKEMFICAKYAVFGGKVIDCEPVMVIPDRDYKFNIVATGALQTNKLRLCEVDVIDSE